MTIGIAGSDPVVTLRSHDLAADVCADRMIYEYITGDWYSCV